MIKITVTDLDDCALRHGYDTTGRISHGPDAETDWAMAYYHLYSRTVMPLAICTGRSWYCTQVIARRMGAENAVCEGGSVIVRDGKEGEIFDSPGFSEYRKNLGYIMDIEAAVRGGLRHIASGLSVPEDRIVMPPKRHGFTIDIAYEDVQARKRVDPKKQWELVMEAIADVRGYIDDGLVAARLNGSTAIDFTIPGVAKNTGTKYLLELIGVEPGQALMIDDAGPAKVIDGPWAIACPQNATDEMKELARSKGRRGYVSPDGFDFGVIDILKRAEAGAFG